MSVGLSSGRNRLSWFAVIPLALAMVGVLSSCDEQCDPIVVAECPPGGDIIPPAAPQGVYPVTGDETVSLFWWPNTEPDLAGYRVWWAKEGWDYYELLATTPNTYYVDRGLDNGTTYFYVVTALDVHGNESEDSEETFDTPRPEGFALRLYNIELRNQGGVYLDNAYDFDEYRVTDGHTDAEADIFFSHGDELYLMYTTDDRTDIQDAGYIPLEDIDWAPDGPDMGWSRVRRVELIMGHSYIVWTRTDNFAKFQVVDMTPDYVVIDWAYQTVAGLPELMRPAGAGVDTGAARGG